MSEKITWVELRQQVAERAGIKESEAGVFLAALIKEIQDGIRTDKSVRVGGLGTFRLQAVAARKSVNVTTGESFIIDGYNKLNFAAEAGVKELIENAGNRKSVAAIHDDITPLKKLGAQAEEIVDILAELGQKPGDEKPVVEEPKEVEPVVEEPIVVEPQVEEPVVEEPVVVEPAVVEPVVEPVVVAPIVEEKKPEPVKIEEKKEEKKRGGVWRWIRDVLITILILLLLLVGGIFLLREGLSGLFDKLAGHEPTEVVEGVNVNENENERPEGYENVNVNVNENVDVDEHVDEHVDEEVKPTYTDFITTEEMHQDSRLAWMAYRYYGVKDLWVFIYDANRDHIANPDNINVGTKIRIPKLSKEQMDINNPSTQQAIAKIKQELGK